MLLVNEKMLSEFAGQDAVFTNHLHHPDFDQSVYTKWLLDSPAKRCIFNHLYGDLLSSNIKSVLDIGGGITPLTLSLRKNCREYQLCEILSHDKHLKNLVVDYLYPDDWATLPKRDYDVVIANDLFPNVDQRLDLFLETFLPHCAEIRLSLTFYNNKRYYITKRVDADEHLVFSAYNGELVKCILQKYKENIIDFAESSLAIFDASPETSLYPNKRHIALLRVRGAK